MKILKIAPFALLLALTACGQDKANNGEKTAIKARQDLMHDWRGANDIIKGMAENPANFDVAVLKEQIAYMDSTKAQMWDYFKDTTQGNKVNELINANPADYQKMIDNFDTALSELNTKSQTATSITDVEPLIGKLNESCGTCHKTYKKH